MEETPMAMMRYFLGMFDDTLDHYHRTCARSNNATIVGRLRVLRETLLQDIDMIATVFVEKMQSHPNLARLNDNHCDYICFGDLHGSLTDLVYLRQLYWRNPDQLKQFHFVFLGDYVDRGIHGFEIAVYLILLKLVYPANFTVLRGNHEILWMNRGFFLEECKLKFGKRRGNSVWRTMNRCFSMLPYAALITTTATTIFCCHGGVPRNLRSLDEIDQIPKGLMDEHRNALALQLLWNDFRSDEYDKKRLFRVADVNEDDDSSGSLSSSESGQREDKAVLKYFVANRVRHIGYIVGHKAVRHFRRKHGINFIVRAHQFDSAVSAQGYNTHSDQRVLTVFSNSGYVGNGNATACVRISNAITSATSSVNIIGLRNERDHDFNHSEIFECDELADMKFDW